MLIRTNVTNIGDPFVVNTEGGYVMYATTFDAQGFRYYKSTDLKAWTEEGLALDLTDSWAYQDFWAPEVIRRHGDGKYVMHFTARRKSDSSLRMGVAIAEQPEGPFLQVKNEPIFDFGYAVIDGSVFYDDDEKPWFCYSRDCSENVIDGKKYSQLYVIRMTEELTQVTGEPKLIATPTYDYECGDYGGTFWNEGASVLRKDGKYWLFYSANCYAFREYCINLAVSNHPDGPYEKLHEINPLVHYELLPGDFSGPGHNSFFVDKEGNLKSAFHIHTDANNPSADRKAVIADVVYENNCWSFVL